MNNELGYCEGDTCNRNGCTGMIDTLPSTNCSCHLSAPCSSCTAPRSFCPECDWAEKDEPELLSTPGTIYISPFGAYWAHEKRTLDSTKIDWFDKPHSSCSMIKEGVYPPDATAADVRKLVDGTFGGRFEYFRDGKFKFIAYTD